MNGDFVDFSNLTFNFEKANDVDERLMLAALHMASTSIQVGMHGLLDPAQSLADMSHEIMSDLLVVKKGRDSIENKLQTIEREMMDVTAQVVSSAENDLDLTAEEIKMIQQTIIDGIFRIVRGQAGLLDILLLIRREAGE